jgi:hypothetical protein
MPREDSFERALTYFTNLVLPKTEDLTSLVSDPSNPLRSVTGPFLSLLVLNALSLIIVFIFWRFAVRLFEATLYLLVSTCALPFRIAGYFSRSGRRFTTTARSTDADTQSKSDHSRAHEDDEFASWKGTFDDTTTEQQSGTHDEEIIHAFTTLGVKAHATDSEVRRAYIQLMKRYHPDLYMKAPAEEQERIRQAALKVRHAYDLLTKELQ